VLTSTKITKEVISSIQKMRREMAALEVAMYNTINQENLIISKLDALSACIGTRPTQTVTVEVANTLKKDLNAGERVTICNL